MCDSSQVTTCSPTAITDFLQTVIPSAFCPLITSLLTFIPSWVCPSHSHFDLVIIPTSSSSSAPLLAVAITPFFTFSHTASVQQFKCHHPSQFSFNSLERLPPLPILRPHPEMLSAACCVSPVSTNRLDCRWWHVWNLWLIPRRARRNPLNRALLLALAGLCNNFALLSPLSFCFFCFFFLDHVLQLACCAFFFLDCSIRLDNTKKSAKAVKWSCRIWIVYSRSLNYEVW